MTSELTGEALEAAVAKENAEAEKRHRQRLTTTTPEQLAAMAQGNTEAMERLLIVYGQKRGLERLKALAQSWCVPDDVLARVQERMKTPPHEDIDLVSAVTALGDLWPNDEIAEFHNQLEALSRRWGNQLLKRAKAYDPEVRGPLVAALRKMFPAPHATSPRPAR
jgi:hypothetical protein